MRTLDNFSALDNLPAVTPATLHAKDAIGSVQSGSLFSFSEINLTVLIFIFGLIALFLFYLLVRSKLANPLMIRMYVIIILVFGTLLVVSSAYATEQIAPVVGFFGTIAGYLLGRTDRTNDTPADH